MDDMMDTALSGPATRDTEASLAARGDKPQKQRSPRILIVRVSAIGDVIHGIPVLCALREAYPHAFLAWVAEGTAGDVLDGRKKGHEPNSMRVAPGKPNQPQICHAAADFRMISRVQIHPEPCPGRGSAAPR